MIIENMPHDEYLKADGLSNSELIMVGQSPADYIWSKAAPVDASKAATKDFGTALHMAILEPHLYNDSVLVSSVKGRETKTFMQEVTDNPDKVVLTELEAEKVRVIKASAMAHPVFSDIVIESKLSEVSIFADDHATGLKYKIRPDLDLVESKGFMADVKTTKDLADWRNDKPWINPLHTLNYGHTAAFYLHVASLHYGFDVNVYKFLVVQKTASLARYPVSVFAVDRDYLQANGFWQQMLDNLATFAKCNDFGAWDFDELPPMFEQQEETTIEFVE